MDIVREGGNGLGKGTILVTLGVMVMAVLTLMLTVATTLATTLSTMAISTCFTISCSAVLVDTALLGGQ